MGIHLKLPQQTPPVQRDLLPYHERTKSGVGVEPAQTPCDNLTGMARQLCYSQLYGVDT